MGELQAIMQPTVQHINSMHSRKDYSGWGFQLLVIDNNIRSSKHESSIDIS